MDNRYYLAIKCADIFLLTWGKITWWREEGSLLKICSRRLLAKLCLPKESHPPKVALCINPAPLAKRQLLYWLRPRAKGSIIPENLLQLHPNRTSRYGTTFLALSPLPHQNFSLQSHEWCRPSWGEMLIIPPFRSFGFGIGRK